MKSIVKQFLFYRHQHPRRLFSTNIATEVQTVWKNNFDRTENKWIGFCQYRKFWSLKSLNARETESIEDLSKYILG